MRVSDLQCSALHVREQLSTKPLVVFKPNWFPDSAFSELWLWASLLANPLTLVFVAYIYLSF